MNWEVIGAVGEMISTLAVVITLFYLARQTAENSRALKASAAREITLAEAEFHQELARDPELKRIMFQSMQAEMTTTPPRSGWSSDAWPCESS